MVFGGSGHFSCNILLCSFKLLFVSFIDAQVREQQRYIALQIRREVELRRRRELEQLKEELRDDWERQQREKLNTLQKLYQESLQLLGQGHRSAKENVRKHRAAMPWNREFLWMNEDNTPVNEAVTALKETLVMLNENNV